MFGVGSRGTLLANLTVFPVVVSSDGRESGDGPVSSLSGPSLSSFEPNTGRLKSCPSTMVTVELLMPRSRYVDVTTRSDGG